MTDREYQDLSQLRRNLLDMLAEAGVYRHGAAQHNDEWIVSELKKLVEQASALAKLDGKTYALQYGANCPHPYLIRMVGKGQGKLDWLAYPGSLAYGLLPETSLTQDIIGSGKTFAEAVTQVIAEHEKVFGPPQP